MSSNVALIEEFYYIHISSYRPPYCVYILEVEVVPFSGNGTNKMLKKRLKSEWKRSLIIILCLALGMAHSIWAQVKFDSSTLWLFAIALIFFLMPEPSLFTPYLRRIKRIKVWQLLEVELNDMESKVDTVEDPIAQSTVIEVTQNMPQKSITEI